MRRIAAVLLTAGAIILVLAIAQLVLPGIAAQRLRDRLSHSGTVLQVKVEAFPAIELLWHHADRVVIRLARYRATPGHLGGTLAQAGDVGSLDASATEIDTGLLTLRDATLRKRGNTLTGTARVTESDLRSAVPFLDGVQPIASGGGQLILRGTATLFGVTASVDATVQDRNGSLVVAPNVPLGGLAAVTVFSDPHVQVNNLTATTTADGFSVAAEGQLK